MLQMSNIGRINIRTATLDDAAALVGIYAPYVEGTAISFEYEVPAVEVFRQRIADISSRHPYLVAEDEDGKVVGYAYARQLGVRAAFQWAVEESIYIDRHYKHRGIGRMLHEALEAELRQRGIAMMYACIAFSEEEDEYLTHDSIRFHSRLGYVEAGHLHRCGKKFGRWYDLVWMEKAL